MPLPWLPERRCLRASIQPGRRQAWLSSTRCGTTAPDITQPKMLRLAVRNLMRQKLRTTITIAAIAFGVAALILSGGFVRDMFIQLGEALIHSQSGHLQ